MYVESWKTGGCCTKHPEMTGLFDVQDCLRGGAYWK